MAQDPWVSVSMPSSSRHQSKRPNALALKQAANWQCQRCGRGCRHQNESLEDFARRIGSEVDSILAHPRRWTLHVTKLDRGNIAPKQPGTKTVADPVVLCGSCHRTYHNSRRQQRQRRRQQQQQEYLGQLTLSDIRLPLTGLQLSLNDWGTPYEIVNPLPSRRRTKSS